jgi:translation initiation factor IF-1
MSQSVTMDSLSTAALVAEVDVIEVGSKHHYFVQCQYLDQVSRPDIVGKTSGWIRTSKRLMVGDIVNVGFTPVANRLGSTEWKPYIKET